ncbi:type I secretion system permease/ATPase [Aureimonas phyllosphaerae]|uniref:ATP-binding cassette subfamily C protein n=1 Tax=Aureimonas phyllosphaerae TaxID=1166078 RepID=A0A7W6BU33_9HYPH|nr:type I secretion system permease/ATPase [Aureimonas phyllosphaerae]MBB3938016.1 ATP-binding cassette subfamily C protein [Aureimonas phyllosphaerae]MBB3962023.1 ATP-binding cassette subfamily C protein [Aureimonas phyllosphaerae]SFF53985.1 ATP-binding cassette, subfamily C [Aureimonas phyllosphaerae]
MVGTSRDASLPVGRAEIVKALATCRWALVGIAILSGVLNILFLTGSFYMLEVYDRVLPSGSIPTLVGLAVIVTILYGFQGIVDMIRGRLLARIGTAVDSQLSGRALQAITRLPLTATGIDSTQPSRDLDIVRNFLAGPGPTALFDLPWIPFYLTICFAFHQAIGWAATIGGLVLVVIALCTEIMSRKPVEAAYTLGRQRGMLSDTFRRNAEVLRAMGMEARVGQSWTEVNDKLAAAQQRCADLNAGLGAISKVTRMLLQSAVLTVGAYLVINGQATGGIIIASSILSARALAPVELAIGQWRPFIATRASWKRLSNVLQNLPLPTAPLDLPPPSRTLSIENLSVAPPAVRVPFVRDATFRVKAGDGLGIIGQSASGKSTLIRAIVGVWAPMNGAVRLDGAAIDQWSADRLGAHIGYLPQELQLFPGTVAQNIARFDPSATPEEVIEAAVAAGVHEMIVRLPDGYETATGENGLALSVGQRQRIGLARALFRKPFLVVLDEPNSNLDADGEAALTNALAGVRLRGGIVIVVAHRPSALIAMNLVLVMANGRVQAFGDKDDILGRVLSPASVAPPPASPAVSDGRPYSQQRGLQNSQAGSA